MADSNAYDVVIIGSGPGGYVAAVRAAQLGLKTACVEKWPRLGGVCLNVGCIPSKALLDSSEHFHVARTGLSGHGIAAGEVRMDLAKMMARKEQVVKELTDNVRKLLENHKVTLVQGTAKLTGRQQVEVASEAGSRTLTAPNIILATGSEPLAPAGLAFDGKIILSSTEALRLDAVPERLGIVGGGYIGLELGSVWMRLGSKVTVIEMLPEIATTLDGQVRRRLQSILKKQGFTFRLGTRVKSATV
jgi:dihydrolipoamide dehydrogenase